MKIDIPERVVSIAFYLFIALALLGILKMTINSDIIQESINGLFQPKVAVININSLLTERSNLLKEKLINARTEAEKQAVHEELNNFANTLDTWLNHRVPEICGKNCLVLDERLVIRGSQVDLTPLFQQEMRK